MSLFHTILRIYCSIKGVYYNLNKTIRSIHISRYSIIFCWSSRNLEPSNFMICRGYFEFVKSFNYYLWLTSKANANCDVKNVFAATLVTLWFVNSATKLSFNFGDIWESKKECHLNFHSVCPSLKINMLKHCVSYL